MEKLIIYLPLRKQEVEKAIKRVTRTSFDIRFKRSSWQILFHQPVSPVIVEVIAGLLPAKQCTTSQVRGIIR